MIALCGAGLPTRRNSAKLEIRANFNRAGVDALELWTDDDLMATLLRFAGVAQAPRARDTSPTTSRRISRWCRERLPPDLHMAAGALGLRDQMPILTAILSVILLARKRRAAAQYAAWQAPPRASVSRWRRAMEHVPAVLMLIAVIALIGAMARPNAVLSLPSRHDTVVLAIDVSGSMNATDMQPTRLAGGAKAARDVHHAAATVDRNRPGRFAPIPLLVVQRPTANREDLLQALGRLQVQDGTSVGGAILTSLQSLFPKEDIDLPHPNGPQDQIVERPPASPPKPPSTPGSETSAAIVLLTDGQANAPPDPVAAAKLAADHGVRIFTVGVGTIKGEVVKGNGISMRVQLDEESLKEDRRYDTGTLTSRPRLPPTCATSIMTSTRAS